MEAINQRRTWALTGESRAYNRRQGIFGKLIPKRDVNSGGPGAWELAARYSNVDLTDSNINGGDMDRISVGLNWYPSTSLKTTVQYGWIDLDRFGSRTTTEVLQVRLAFLLGL